VAPLAATVLATLTVGAIALARDERDRRLTRARRARERRFTLLDGEQPGDGMKRMALAQLDLAIELVQGEGDVPNEEAVHDTRKAIKRVRALVRLMRDELGERTFARENGALRDVARRLAGARDAEVMASTLDRLLEGHERGLARRPPVVALRAQLAAERDQAARRGLGDAATRDATLNELYAVRARVATWSLSRQPGLRLAEPGLRRLYRQGRRRRGRARRAKGRDTRALHQWRKRVKDLRYAAQMLGLEELAKRADDLQERLGDEHDLALLAERVNAPDSPLAGGGRRRKRTRKGVLKLIARRRAGLREQALREGRRLYKRKPKEFAKRARKRFAKRAHKRFAKRAHKRLAHAKRGSNGAKRS
jgi:CHAD domain-containing protein